MNDEELARRFPDKVHCYNCNQFREANEYLYLEYTRICSTCLTPYDVGYIAGFFDGEGHVEFPPKGKLSGGGIRIGQVLSDPLRFILTRFPDGLLYHYDNGHQGIHHLIYNGWAAIPICGVLREHLIVKYSEVSAYLALFGDKSNVAPPDLGPTITYVDEEETREEPLTTWPITKRDAELQ